ncbi:Rv0361 family membrane protein [Mycobacterium kiyosense]|nr:membrane protein [Mycobacterium kiyosense]
MPNAPEPDRGGTGSSGTPGPQRNPDNAETETVAIVKRQPEESTEATVPDGQPERRFTAPGFDEKETQVFATATEAPTEVFETRPAPAAGPTAASPAPPIPPAPPLPPNVTAQSIPARGGVNQTQAAKNRNWGWVLAIVVIVLALAAIAIFGTVLLTRGKHEKASQEDQVRQTIQNFDVAIQRGDLTALRSITCGTTRDGYVDYDEKAWAETYRRVSAAKQYPMIASIDQIVVNGEHAEANVTTFMAYDPQVRSTRSLDLQFRDDQWKICQSN